MKYITLLIAAIISFVASKFMLSFINPNDPEGTNLLITTIVAIFVSVLLLSVYLFVSKRHKAKS